MYDKIYFINHKVLLLHILWGYNQREELNWISVNSNMCLQSKC
jgi:hypothetical protein